MQPIRLSLAALAIVLAVAPAAFAQSGEAKATLSACKGDIEKLCASVQPGGGRIGECLKAHRDQVSVGCKLAIAQDVAAHRQGATGAAAPQQPQ
jgi:hypothetical protein